MNEAKMSIRGYSMILTSALLFGTYGVWSRLMGGSFAPFYQAWIRSLLIILIMLPFMLAAKSFRKIRRADWPALGVFIAFCVCTQVPLYYAFNHAPIGTVQLIFYSVFVITAYAVGHLYLGESITKIKLISMALAFCGLALVFGASVLAFAPLGLALAALNGVASGGEVASSKKASNTYSPALVVFWGWVFTFLTHLPLSLLLGEKQVPIQINDAWLWLVVYALVNAAAFWLVIMGFRFVDASIGSLIGLMEVVFGVVFGAIIFHEVLTLHIYIGGLLILAAAMLPDLVNIIKHKRTKTAVEPIRQI
ncbi:MAG TPA: DMT family transporter [Candidatus Polarisedimenticolaceae bacterium]|nr:DMT family transporter [Candidatus Polarisedimenticolaceae bacterium]